MQTNPESAAVEAVAAEELAEHLGFNIELISSVQREAIESEVAVVLKVADRFHQSALDALRGEVVSTNARCIELGERIARLADLRANDAAYIKKLDGIIEETGVRPVSCINPYEDLKAVVLSLKKRAAEADAAERRVAELVAAVSKVKFTKMGEAFVASAGDIADLSIAIAALTKESP